MLLSLVAYVLHVVARGKSIVGLIDGAAERIHLLLGLSLIVLFHGGGVDPVPYDFTHYT